MTSIRFDYDELCSYLYSAKKKTWIKYSKATNAFLYKKNKRINILNLHEEEYPIKNFLKKMDKKKIFNSNGYEITHLFYEFGHYLNDLELLPDENLAIEIEYSQMNEIPAPLFYSKKIQFYEVEVPDKATYMEKIAEILRGIRAGQYYQLNFTQRWKYQLINPVSDFLFKFISAGEKLGAMAHVTIVPSLNILWLTNTPECLFVAKKQAKKILIDTFPIKGTTFLNVGLRKAKELLVSSIKDLAELDMITDLMRNDLNKLQLPFAQVVKRRFFFSVPNLLQQASWVRGIYSSKLHLGELIRAIFPGGSITGAPKVSSMNAIATLEHDRRSFYCGSTIYHSKNNCSASINIRSATLNLLDNSFLIGAGGGITLLSDIEGEWDEMIAKKNSLLNLWE
jgi:para-aminobenzoate synthetase component 1